LKFDLKMLVQILLLPIYFLFSHVDPNEEVFFKSSMLQKIELTPYEGQFSILDDSGESIEVEAMKDDQGVPYWYRRIFTPVCLTGECLMVDVGIYWYCTGEFLGLEVYREHLTKTDHSEFSKEDYERLIDILSNDWSSLREYEFTDLVDESEEGVDGVSGATKKEIAEQAVEDAVYTTYTLWHLIHVGEKEQLAQLTADLLNRKGIFESLAKTGSQRYMRFLMEQLAEGRIQPSPQTDLLLVSGLNTTADPSLKKLAVRALAHSDTETPLIQNELVKIYPKASMEEKLQVLTALKKTKVLSSDLIQVLAADLSHQNEWFVVRLLDVLKDVPSDHELVSKHVEILLDSESTMVRKAAEGFYQNQSGSFPR
jgi:hypothetical protein